MSLRDFPAHSRGRQHQLALSKVDANLRPLPESAGIGSLASETVIGSTFSTETVKQMTNKAKRSKKVKQPKSIVESIATPPTSAGLDSSGFNDSRLGFFVHSFPDNLQNNSNPNTFICDQDTGRCGQYMNLTNEYVFLTIFLLTLLLICSECGDWRKRSG